MAKRRVYSADVPVFATIYVIAKNEREARKIIREQAGCFIEVGESDDISGANYMSPDCPDISYSPSMTVADKLGRFVVDLAEEGEVDDS